MLPEFIVYFLGFVAILNNIQINVGNGKQRIPVITCFVTLIEVPFSSLYDVSLQWLETGEGEMFFIDTQSEIEEIISLYKRLHPYFKKFIIRQLRELVDFK
jgi:hypothetical protein